MADADQSPFWTFDGVRPAIPRRAGDVAPGLHDAKLGISEVSEPPLPTARGGRWFEAGE